MYYKSTSVPRIIMIIGLIFLIPIIVFVVRAQPTLFSKPTYYSNHHVLYEVGLNEEVAIGGYIINRYDEKLYITNDHRKVEVSLHNYNDIRSLHMSHDQRYLAFDIIIDDGVKMFVVNLETGEYENISEFKGDNFNYSRYKVPYGLAWSPEQNILAFVGGYEGDDTSIVTPRVNIYNPDIDIENQDYRGSHVFAGNLYGIKWNIDGKSIYHIVDALEGHKEYIMYQIAIIADDDYLRSGEFIKIKRLTFEEYEKWFN